MAYPMQGRTVDGQTVFVQVDAEGRIVVTGIGGGGGGGGSGAGVIPGVDTNGTRWVMIVNSSTTPPTITYVDQSTGAAGTPVGGFTPDADQNGLTDAQLRASAVSVSPNVTRGGGAVDANTQRVTLASDGPGVTALNNIDTDLGAQADAAATSDTGAFSLIALVKRGLTNWTALLARIPALVSGRVPVDGSGVTQPVSASALPLPSGAATSALQTSGNTSLASLDTKIPSQQISGLLPVDTLAAPGVARTITVTATAASAVLTSTCRRVTMYATQDTFYSISGAATTSSHFIAAGERLDFDVPANTTVSTIRSTADGVLRITELV